MQKPQHGELDHLIFFSPSPPREEKGQGDEEAGAWLLIPLQVLQREARSLIQDGPIVGEKQKNEASK